MSNFIILEEYAVNPRLVWFVKKLAAYPCTLHIHFKDREGFVDITFETEEERDVAFRSLAQVETH